MGRRTNATLFREVLEIIFKAPEWGHWHQAPGERIEFTVPRLRIKGLLSIEKGEREWWQYPVDRQRLRTEGPAAMARDFLDGYQLAREA